MIECSHVYFGNRARQDEDMRRRYLELQSELTKHLTPEQVAGRVGDLEKEVAAAKERTAKALREQTAAAELLKIKTMLTQLAGAYPDTDAGKKAQRACEAINPGAYADRPPVSPLPSLDKNSSASGANVPPAGDRKK